MAIKKVIEIDVDVLNAQGGIDGLTNSFKEASKDTESLRTQMRKAQQEVAELSAKFGATSKEATEAAKKAAELKDRIGDAKSLTDAFNPDAKFKSLTASLTGVAGGFAAVQGAMGLLGTENKDLEQQLLKVQSAMAIAAGAQQVGESIDAFKQLGAVVKSYSIVQKAITAGQWLWNAAMAANPIGAIVAVVTALVAAGYALVNMFIASSEATKKAEKANKELNKQLETQIKTQKKANEESDIARDYQLKMAKASGKSAEEIRKLSVELANQEVSQKMANAQTLRAIAIEAMRVAGLEDATDAEKETAKNALKAFNDANNDLKVAVTNRRKLLLDNKVAETQEQTDADNEARKKRKEANEKAETEAKEKRQKDRKEELEKINAQSKEVQDALKKSEEEKQKLEADLKAKAKAIQDRLIEETKPKMSEREKLEAKYQEEYDLLVSANESTLALNAKHTEDLLALDAKEKQVKKEADDKEIANKKIIKEQELALAGATFGKVAELLGKNSKVGKAFAISQALINTYQGITAELATKAATPFEFGVKLVNIASVAAIGFKAVKNIISTKADGGGGGAPSIGGGGGGAGGGGAQAPSFNVVGNSGVNQIAQTLNREQAPIQAYVVANNVTTAQSANRSIIENASLG
jgi:hypothetical protein